VLDDPSPFRSESRQLIRADLVDDDSIMCTCRCYTEVNGEAKVLDTSVNSEIGIFKDLFYELPVRKSGYHHPDGILWIRDKKFLPEDGRGRVSLQKVAPTILNLFDVQRPAYMDEAIKL